jgi:hypothetical protein
MPLRKLNDPDLQAQALRDTGERVVSTDEMTGIQALERKPPTIPMGPGRVERREFEYIRRGTVTLIANFDVAQGMVVTPAFRPTRTEEDFVGPPAATTGFFTVRRLSWKVPKTVRKEFWQ